LRERPEDISVLALRFALRTAAELNKQVSGIAPDALELLQQYAWPGNVRELQHAIERAVILCEAPVIGRQLFEGQRFGLSASRIAPGEHESPAHDGNGAVNGNGNGHGARGSTVVLESLDIAAAEKLLISRALEKTGNNRTRAAELLGIHVRTLRNKLNTPDQS
jgi:DNA-binding NtrC family response regulator